MKKFIIILGIILTSGIAALALSHNTNTDPIAQTKIERDALQNSPKGYEHGASKNDIANAD